MRIILGDYPVVLLLVLFRVAGILLPLPFFAVPSEAGWLLAAISLPVALVMASTLSVEWVEAAALIEAPGDLVIALLGETLLGAAIGTVCGVFIGAYVVAGIIAARGASLSMAQEVDPVSGESSGILAQIWRMLFLVTVLALDAHLVIFRIMARTFEVVPPPWTGWLDHGLDIALLGGLAFRAGVTIALPIMVVSLLISIAMALMARMASEFNILFLSLPFRLVSGVYVLALAILLSSAFQKSMAYDMLSTVVRLFGW